MTPNFGESSGQRKILQKDLGALMNWSNKYLLKFNPQNCDVMRISPKVYEQVQSAATKIVPGLTTLRALRY